MIIHTVIDNENTIQSKVERHEYITTVLTKNYKVIENLMRDHSLISPDIAEDETIEIWSDRPKNLFIKSTKKPYILSSNQYIKGCRSGSPIYCVTTDCGHVIANAMLGV